MNTVKISLCRPGAIMPCRQTAGSAGYDCYCPSDVRIRYGRQIVPTGIKTEFNESIALDSRTRAGYAALGLLVYDRWNRKHRIDADVILGLIDSDYRGEIGAILNVKSLKVLLFGWLFKFRVVHGQALSQLCFWKVPDTALVQSDELNHTERGTKGFGAANGEGA